MAARNEVSKVNESANLTINQMIEILDQIGRKSYKILSENYGVGVSTISDIKKKGPEIREYKWKSVEMGCQRPVKLMRLGKDQEFRRSTICLVSSQKRRRSPIKNGNKNGG